MHAQWRMHTHVRTHARTHSVELPRQLRAHLLHGLRVGVACPRRPGEKRRHRRHDAVVVAVVITAAASAAAASAAAAAAAAAAVCCGCCCCGTRGGPSNRDAAASIATTDGVAASRLPLLRLYTRSELRQRHFVEVLQRAARHGLLELGGVLVPRRGRDLLVEALAIGSERLHQSTPVVPLLQLVLLRAFPLQQHDLSLRGRALLQACSRVTCTAPDDHAARNRTGSVPPVYSPASHAARKRAHHARTFFACSWESRSASRSACDWFFADSVLTSYLQCWASKGECIVETAVTHPRRYKAAKRPDGTMPHRTPRSAPTRASARAQANKFTAIRFAAAKKGARRAHCSA
jgi:hypothetical protein